MVFFNYATMQMAAKIVYYGPGLCGKTTNLHYIYSRTSPGSRGEMVSLETETDRTLFFDLLPLDVGVIGGFKTRVQLYTVPGQVFYNTTRKLVLKGVDGIVFVADSQRAMKEANVESLNNLRTNLAEIGLQLDDLPLVFQYNKRDLSNILDVAELTASLNAQGGHESYEACAVLGQGVFETLKAISKHTLRSLKKRMLGEERPARPAPARAAPPPPPPPPAPSFAEASSLAEASAAAEASSFARVSGDTVAVRPDHAPPSAPLVEQSIVRPEIAEESKPIELEDLPQEAAPKLPPALPELPPELPGVASFLPPKPPPPPSLRGREAFDAEDVETVQEFEQALDSLDSPLPEPEPTADDVEIGEVSFAETKEVEEVAPKDVKRVHLRSNIDILAELEKLRKNATAAPQAERPARRPTEGISIDDLLASSLNHRKEINRVFELEVPSRDLARGRQITIGLRFEDKDKNPVGEEKSFSIDLHTRQDIERLLLSLKFHILGK
jgi:signal recognition particle receptor subunit beta